MQRRPKDPELDASAESDATPTGPVQAASDAQDWDLAAASPESMRMHDEAATSVPSAMQDSCGEAKGLHEPQTEDPELGSTSESAATPVGTSSQSFKDSAGSSGNGAAGPSPSDLALAAKAGREELAASSAASQGSAAPASDNQSSKLEQQSTSTPELAPEPAHALDATASAAASPAAGEPLAEPSSFQTEDPELSAVQEEAQTPLARGANSQAWADAEPASLGSGNGASLQQAGGNGVGHSGVQDPRAAISTAPELTSSAEDLSTPQAYRPESTGAAAAKSSQDDVHRIQKQVSICGHPEHLQH